MPVSSRLLRSIFRSSAAVILTLAGGRAEAASPYPASAAVPGIAWSATTTHFGAGGDIWAATTRPDGRVEVAWGDGNIGCGKRVSYGTGHLPATPTATITKDGCGPGGSRGGKIASLLYVGGTLWGLLNAQDVNWPRSTIRLVSSPDNGANWTVVGRALSATLKPLAFVQDVTDGNVYVLEQKSVPVTHELYLGRIAVGNIAGIASGGLSHFSGTAAAPAWGSASAAKPIIAGSPLGLDYPTAGRLSGPGRWYVTAGLQGADTSMILDAPQPWGPWTTVEWVENGWMGGASHSDERQTLGFPSPWQNGSGVAAVWGCYGTGCGQGSDHGNITAATLAAPAAH
jgi:hypothetical protein